MVWYFQAQDGEPSGPYDLDAILSRVRSRQILRHTLIWKAGMPDWKSASEIRELYAALEEDWGQPPPLPSQSVIPCEQEDLVDLTKINGKDNNLDAHQLEELLKIPLSPLATPWSRYWARAIDLLIFVPISSFFLGFLAGLFGYEDDFVQLLKSPLYYIVLLPPVITLSCLFLALCHGIFGNTIGKKIFRIHVRRLIGEEDAAFWFAREFRVSVQGLFLGIPLLTQVSMTLQFYRVLKDQPASYDFATARVIQYPISRLRFFFGFILVIALSIMLRIMDNLS